jgi:drug/metabolite transporter (DMT)-like permease
VYGLTHTSLVVGNTLSALAPVLSVPVSVALKLEKFSWIRTLAVLTVVVGLSLLFR